MATTKKTVKKAVAAKAPAPKTVKKAVAAKAPAPKAAPKKKAKAIKFDDLMKLRKDGESSFKYEGVEITMVTDTSVAVPTKDGDKIFYRGDYLVTNANGELEPVHHDLYKG